MAIDLYSLLPSIIRWQDSLASGNDPNSVLKGILSCLENEFDITKAEIDDLAKLIDPDQCPEEYLPLISNMLGLEANSSWPEEKKRLFVKSIVLLHHMKGQRRGAKSFLTMNGYARYFPWELWKSMIYETVNYSLYSGVYGYPYKSARVDIRRPEDTGPEEVHTKNREAKTLVEGTRPIHVLVRQYPVPGGDLLDKGLMAIDSAPYNEPFASVVAGFEETVSFEEDLEVTETCTGACESGCEIACEGGFCQLDAEACAGYCELHCQDACELVLQ